MHRSQLGLKVAQEEVWNLLRAPHAKQSVLWLWNGVEELVLGLWINKDILSPDLFVSSFQKYQNQLKNESFVCV